VDRNLSWGCHGIFYQEVKSALYGHTEGLPVFGYVAGLGGRDITPETFKDIARDALARKKNVPAEEIVWIGVKR